MLHIHILQLAILLFYIFKFFIAINTDQEFHINIEENVTIKQVQNFKYFGVNLNKKGINSEDIVIKFSKENK